MKKRFAAVLAATAIVGVASAFAANPFSDVTPSDWAYQAVSQLASQGIINGYPNGTFQGEKDITRYEVAQMVAKAMAHESRANAEQQALIGQLAQEFSAELNNLGVRVSNVESQLGNVRLSGDARTRVESNKAKRTYVAKKLEKQGKDGNEVYSQRLRLNLTSKVDAKTMVNARLVAEYKAGHGTSTTITDGQKEVEVHNNEIKFDRLNVSHDFGSVQAVVGRQDLFLGDGLVMDDTFDGIHASTSLGNVAVSAGYGYSTDDDTAWAQDATIVYGQARAAVMPGVELGAFIAKGSAEAGKQIEIKHKIYGVSLDAQLAQNLALSAEYARRSKGDDNVVDGRGAWLAGLTWGNYDMADKGSHSLMVQYLRADVNSPIVSTTWDFNRTDNVKGWLVQGNYALAPNLGLSLVYNFHNRAVDVDKATGSYNDKVMATLDYQF